MNLDVLEKNLKNFYSNSVNIKEHKSHAEIYLPIYLDDMIVFSLFISKLKYGDIILSTNLLSELEYTLYKTKEITCDIRKKYYHNDEEFSEIKKALKEENIKIDSDILEYKIKNIDEDNLYKEIICYSERVKIYYNNLYNILSERYLKKKEKRTLYYQQFKDVMKEINKKIKFDKYKNTISSNPIFYKDEKIITAARDLDSLAKLYIDISLMNEKKKEKKEMKSKGLLYLDEPKENSHKIIELKREFEKINFKIISTIEVSNKKTIEQIEDFING